MNILMKVLCGILAVHMYAMPAYVADVDYDRPYVEFVDYATGNKWESDDANGLDFDDDVVLLMYDNMTEDQTDDVIVKICPDNGTIYMDAYFVKGRN